MSVTLAHPRASTLAILVAGLGMCAGAGVLAGLGYGLHALGVVVAIALFLLVRQARPGLGVLDSFLVLNVCGLLVLNRGWSYLGVQVGPLPLYVGELVIAVAILATLGRLGERPRPHRATLMWLLVPYSVIGVAHMVFDAQVGLESFRNFSLVYYAILVPAGFYLAMSARRRRATVRLVGGALLVQMLYNTTYPWRVITSKLGPTFASGVPLIGNHASSYLAGVMAIAFCVLLGGPVFGWRRGMRLATAAFGVFVLAIVQARGGFLSLASLFLLLLIYGPRGSLRGALAILVVFMLGLGVLEVSGLQIRGERTTVGLDNLVTIARSIVPDSSARNPADPEFDRDVAQGMSGTAKMRLGWWKKAVRDTFVTPQTALFGAGFAHVLVPVKLNERMMVRHPHNIYVSFLARTGLVGAITFTLFLVFLLAQLLSRTRAATDPVLRNLFLFFGASVLAVMVTGLVSPVYETPYQATVHFFLHGFALGLVDLDRRGLLEAEDVLPVPRRRQAARSAQGATPPVQARPRTV